MIQFECPGCRSLLRYPDDQAGTGQKCGKCGQPVQVPPIAVRADKAPRPSNPASLVLAFGYCSFIPFLGLAFAVLAIVLGIIALELRRGYPVARGMFMALAGLALQVMIIPILLSSYSHSHELARQAICKSRLKGLGTAMAIYSSPCRNEFPYNAGSGGATREPTALNNLALLLLKTGHSGKMMVCPSVQGDESVGQPLIVEKDGQGATLIVDEHGNPDGRNRISYSYQAAMHDGRKYTGNGVADDFSGALAIMADRTPGSDCEVDWSGNLSESARRKAISRNHNGDLINILFLDIHVAESKRGDAESSRYSGYSYGDDDERDNIYTVGPGPAGRYVPNGAGHTDGDDSVLISDDGN